MDEIKQWIYETIAEKTINNLIKNGFEAIQVLDWSEASKEIMRRNLPTQSVGFGGSVMVRELGLIPKLEQQGNRLYDHWKPGLTQEESLKIKRAQ